MSLRVGAGIVKLIVWHGWDPGQREWGCPIRESWGLRPHQELSPGLEDKLAFTVTATTSYAEAAALVEKWGGQPVDDSTLHALTQRLGERAEQQMELRLETVP